MCCITDKERAHCTMTCVHKNPPAPETGIANKPGEHLESQCRARNDKNSELNEFLKNLKLSEKKKDVQNKITNLDKDVADEDPNIGKSWSVRLVVIVAVLLVVIGYAMQAFAGSQSRLSPWLRYGGILVNALATVSAAFIGWRRKRDLAKIQFKLDALDIWEKYHPQDAESDSENNIKRREAYLLKQSYVNTVLWGLSGVTILSAFAVALGPSL